MTELIIIILSILIIISLCIATFIAVDNIAIYMESIYDWYDKDEDDIYR